MNIHEDQCLVIEVVPYKAWAKLSLVGLYEGWAKLSLVGLYEGWAKLSLVGLYEGWAQRAQPELLVQLGKPRAGAVSECVFTCPARPMGLRPLAHEL